MKTRSIFKVPQGKLLKIYTDVNEEKNTINSIKITGDFFAYPEEAIIELESLLKNIPINEDALYQTISTFIENSHVQLIGLNATSLTEAILRCR
jgi:lipoate-protein ligase A